MKTALSALLVMAVATSAPAAEPNRIAAVENGLRAPIAVAGEPLVTSSMTVRMRHYGVPGVSVAIIDNGRIAWAKGYGVAERRRPVTPMTRFQAGSISKAVTAVAGMQMAGAGRLPLDQDVNQILKSWKLPRSPAAGNDPVTLRQLFSHTAGVGVHGFYPGYEPGVVLPTPVQILDGTAPATNPAIKVEAPPGKAFDYSGGGYQVVQQILTDISGRPFADLLRISVFRPLGMARSSFVQISPARAPQGTAVGHDRDGVELPTKWYLHPEMAAAGLWSTPSDLAHLGIALAAAWNGRKSSVLNSKTARTILTRQTGGWALGFDVEGEGRSLRFSHGGDNPGFKAIMLVYPALGKGAVVMTNGDRGDRLSDEILFSVAAAYGWPEYAPKIKVKAVVTDAELMRVAGTYVLDERPDTRLIIVPKAGALSLTLVQSTGQNTAELLPLGNGRFFRRDIDFELQFAGGAPASQVTIIQDGSSFAATRVGTQH